MFVNLLLNLESAKSRGWRGFVCSVDCVGQILTWVAWVEILVWVAWVQKILAWVPWVHVLAWVAWLALVKRAAWVNVLLFNHTLQKIYIYVFYGTLYICTNQIHQALNHTYFVSCF